MSPEMGEAVALLEDLESRGFLDETLEVLRDMAYAMSQAPKAEKVVAALVLGRWPGVYKAIPRPEGWSPGEGPWTLPKKPPAEGASA